jgi:tRNA-splicing ligase RtcB
MQVIYDQNKQRVPIKAWLNDLDEGTLEQALNLARLPFAARHVALMPDAHLGYGMPIGGVLAAKDYVVPNAVGVDIGCGMHARRTNVEVGRLAAAHPGQGTVLRAVMNQIQRAVPTGNGPVGNHASLQSWDDIVSDEAVVQLLNEAPPELEKAWRDSGYQLGTLGGGKVAATLA